MDRLSQLIHLREYTRTLKKHLPAAAFEPVPARALWILPHLAVVVVGIVAIASWITSPWWMLPVSLLIGHSFACLGFLAHEILHGAVTRRPWLRDVYAAVCFFPFLIGPRLWRKWHNVEHHGHTQHDAEDPDAMGTLETLRERPFLRAFYRIAPWLRSLFTFAAFSVWFTAHGIQMLVKFLPEFPARQRRVVLAQFAVPLLFWVGLAVLLGPGKAFFAVVLPMLTANFIVMSYIATNHLLNPLTDVNDPLANSLSVTVPKLFDVLHFNFSHHTEHHIFPAMNAKFMPEVKRRVKEFWPDRYNEMPHWKALRALWKTPRLYRDAEESPLVDPVRDYTFPTLGRGLDPDQVVPVRGEPVARQDRVEEESSRKPGGHGKDEASGGAGGLAALRPPLKAGETGAKP